MRPLLSQAALALFGSWAVGCGGTNDSGGDPPSIAVQQQAITAKDSAGVEHHGLMVTTDSLAQASSLSESVVPILAEEGVVPSVASFDDRVRDALQNLRQVAEKTGEGGTAFIFEEPSIVGVQFSLGQERTLPGDPLQSVHPASSSSSYPFAMSVSPTHFAAMALSSNIFCSAGASAFSTLVACASKSGALVEFMRNGTIALEGNADCPPFGWGTFTSSAPNSVYNVEMQFSFGTYVYTSGYLNCFFF
jgi:hypothetical protein